MDGVGGASGGGFPRESKRASVGKSFGHAASPKEAEACEKMEAAEEMEPVDEDAV